MRATLLLATVIALSTFVTLPQAPAAEPRAAQLSGGAPGEKLPPGGPPSGLPAEKGAPRADKPEEDALAGDLKLLQGKWVMMRGDTYRNYQEAPRIWHWKKEKEEKPKAAAAKDDVGKAGGAEKKKPLSPEAIFEKGIEGKATVKFLVDEVHTVNIDSLFVPDVSHAQVIKTKVPGAKDDEEFVVTVSRETATRLLRLGIADPAAHFRGKVMQVSGTIERIKRPSTPSTTVYKIQVTSLDQLEDIRKP